MTARDEAERLHQCRIVFERAVADRCSMMEARARVVRERWAEADRRLAARRCGTVMPPPAAGAQPELWWQR